MHRGLEQLGIFCGEQSSCLFPAASQYNIEYNIINIDLLDVIYQVCFWSSLAC